MKRSCKRSFGQRLPFLLSCGYFCHKAWRKIPKDPPGDQGARLAAYVMATYLNLVSYGINMTSIKDTNSLLKIPPAIHISMCLSGLKLNSFD